MILEILFPTLREMNHLHSVRIDEALKNFVSKVTDNEAKNAFDMCFNSFMDKKHQDELRMGLVRRLCIPLIPRMSVANQIEIFSERIIMLMEVISQGLPSHLDPFEKKTRLCEKTCAFYFIESLYTCLPGTTIKERINPKYCTKADVKGNEV